MVNNTSILFDPTNGRTPTMDLESGHSEGRGFGFVYSGASKKNDGSHFDDNVKRRAPPYWALLRVICLVLTVVLVFLLIAPQNEQDDALSTSRVQDKLSYKKSPFADEQPEVVVKTVYECNNDKQGQGTPGKSDNVNIDKNITPLLNPFNFVDFKAATAKKTPHEGITSTGEDAPLGEWFNEVLTHITNRAPTMSFSPHHKEGCQLDAEKSEDSMGRTEEQLLSCLDISNEVIEDLHVQHKGFVSDIKGSMIPKFKELKHGYEGEGIVIVGGGSYSLLVLGNVRAIRQYSGPKMRNIPIEILISYNDRGDREFCDNVIPKIDPSGLTKCIYIHEIIGPEIASRLNGYALKGAALIFSSFERVLLLDADDYVISNIDHIFTSDIFREKGLVLWPDYWHRLHHPAVYDIAGIKVNKKKRVRYSIDVATPVEILLTDRLPFHDLEGTLPDSSTESGQLLVDKSKHLDTLLLAFYYNFHGGHYYKLLGQGYPGEGDKDAFPLAAASLHGLDSFYTVRTPVRSDGHWCYDGDNGKKMDNIVVTGVNVNWCGSAMVQHDYVVDATNVNNAIDFMHMNITRTIENKIKTELDISDMNLVSEADYTRVSNEVMTTLRSQLSLKPFVEFMKTTPAVFLHVNYPKFNPVNYANENKFTYIDTELKPEGYTEQYELHYRQLSDVQQYSVFDLEYMVWRTYKDVFCSGEDNHKYFIVMSFLNDENNVGYLDKMCKYIDDRTKYYASTTWEK